MAPQKTVILPLPARTKDRRNALACNRKSAPSFQPVLRKQHGMGRPKRVFGCTTCRVRHLKCDENKPSCKTCTSTGRICDGYPIIPSNQGLADTASLPVPPSPAGPMDLRELRALAHFRTASAPTLASFFDSYFWSCTVLRMSLASPGVRHAVVSLTTILERSYLATNSTSSSPMAEMHSVRAMRDDHFALVQYNKAIRCLTQGSDSSMSIDVVMLICLLFVCIEAARGNVQMAIMHFSSGMKAAVTKIYTSSSSQPSDSAQGLSQEVLPLLYRIELLSMLFDYSPTWSYPVTMDGALPDQFRSHGDARDSLVHLMNMTMRLFRMITDKRYQGCVSLPDLCRQSDLQLALDTWAEKHETYVAKAQTTPRGLQAAQLLRLHRAIAKIMLARAAEWNESASDLLLPEFQAALELAESVARDIREETDVTDGHTGVFLLDMEIVPPVYFVAIKCRQPATRRRAIKLLRRLHRREGFFTSELAASLAERVMEVEEAHLTDYSGGQLPEEKDRIHHTDLMGVFEVNNGAGCRTTFFTKPGGIAALWCVWEETISCRSTTFRPSRDFSATANEELPYHKL